jgi:hypothetical protein
MSKGKKELIYAIKDEDDWGRLLAESDKLCLGEESEEGSVGYNVKLVGLHTTHPAHMNAPVKCSHRLPPGVERAV